MYCEMKLYCNMNRKFMLKNLKQLNSQILNLIGYYCDIILKNLMVFRCRLVCYKHTQNSIYVARRVTETFCNENNNNNEISISFRDFLLFQNFSTLTFKISVYWSVRNNKGSREMNISFHNQQLNAFKRMICE